MQTIQPEVNPDRGGLSLRFDLQAGAGVQCSPAWTSAGRHMQFYRLLPGQSLRLPAGRNFIKVISGRLGAVNRSCLAPPFAIRSTEIEAESIAASTEPCLLALMNLPFDRPPQVTMTTQVQFEGPLSEQLSWQSFDDKYGAFLDAFAGHDCHMANGFHLLDEKGAEQVYVNPWICGKGVDLTTHNHAGDPSPQSPVFAEVHWVLAAGTTAGGMYTTPEPGATERKLYPMGLGDEHGPFYDLDDKGMPVMRPNGAVSYPWHGWRGGTDDAREQAYDYVWAFEISPAFIEACQDKS
ncbi:MAG: hypothetical protein VW840_02685 [Gammaproteobacteria bacterium]